MNFLLQTINGQIQLDFVWIMREAKRYYEWWGEEQLGLLYADIDCMDDLKPDDYIPVGTVEFVSKFLKTYYPQAQAALTPLNVPRCLFPFAGRVIENICSGEDFSERFKQFDSIYVKSLDKIKDDFNGPKYARTGTISDWYESKDFVRCQVSEMIDIASEWRVIVFNGEIQHVGNYSGDCLVFPDGEAIRNMVKAYGEAAPKAWTLDVAVTTDGKTVVLECHRFFSCGLYGYADYRRIPKMYSQCWREMLTTR